MKKTVSFLLLLALICCLSASAFAFDEYVFDEKYAIKDIGSLNAMADDIYNSTGIVISYFIGNSDDSANGHEHGEKLFRAHFGDAEGMMLVDRFDDEKLYFYCTDEINKKMTGDASMALLQVYDSQYDYDSAVREYILTAEKMLEAMGYSVGENAPDGAVIPETRQTGRIADEAGVLSASALSELNSMADSISEQYKCDVCAVFVNSTDGKDILAFADDYYDYNGLGYGDGDDGVLLAVDVVNRKYAVSTYGYGLTAFTDYGQEYMDTRYVGELKENDWEGAARNYLEVCGELLYAARSGKPIDNYAEAEKGSYFSTFIVINLVIGFAVSFICVGVMKKKHTDVKMQYSAREYVRPGSFDLGYRNDRFIRSQVTRVARPKPQEHSSGGGSSSHISSSGRSHGGHSGSF